MHCIDQVINELAEFNFPIVMVNDASSNEATQLFNSLENKYQRLTVIHHKENQGKGGAVQTGLFYAHEKGFDYAIQVDADGQHCLDDIHRLLSESKKHPNTLISGKPVYDESVPKHRYWARYITHFWVMVETLSLKLADTMCGFRVYPVKPCVELFNDINLGKRMDFDIEVLVRLYWRGVSIRFISTKVIYPENGISHFKALEDNVRISWMHTRLFFGMLWRSPMLIGRNIKSCLK